MPATGPSSALGLTEVVNSVWYVGSASACAWLLLLRWWPVSAGSPHCAVAMWPPAAVLPSSEGSTTITDFQCGNRPCDVIVNKGALWKHAAVVGREQHHLLTHSSQ